jgi:enoyl-CoA hydratase/carnithine racemase
MATPHPLDPLTADEIRAAASLVRASARFGSDALGMINRVVPRDDLLSAARRMSEQLAAFDHDALWMTKRTIQRAASMSAAEALEMASDASQVMRLHAPR